MARERITGVFPEGADMSAGESLNRREAMRKWG